MALDLVIVILVCCFPLLGIIWVEFETNRQQKRDALKRVVKDLLIFGHRCNFLTISEVRQLEVLIDRDVKLLRGVEKNSTDSFWIASSKKWQDVLMIRLDRITRRNKRKSPQMIDILFKKYSDLVKISHKTSLRNHIGSG